MAHELENCPDCGKPFRKHGLALHRIQKHGATLSTPSTKASAVSPSASPTRSHGAKEKPAEETPVEENGNDSISELLGL
jgi:hypothetical protein